MSVAEGLPGLISGLQQGYSFVDDIERKKKEDVRLDNQDKRAQNQDDRTGQEFAQKKKIWGKEDAYEADRRALAEQFFPKQQPPTVPLAAAGVAAPNAPAAPMDPYSDSPATAAAPGQPSPMAGNPMASAPAAQALQQGTGAQPAPKPDQMGNMNNTLDFAIKSALIDVKHGKMDGAGLLTLQKTVEGMRSENMDKAISLMNQGRYQEAESAFNSTGDHTTFKVIDSKDGVFKVGATEVPTKLVTVRDESGNVRTINTAQTLFQRQAMDKIMTQTQKGIEEAETSRHNQASEKAAMVHANASAVSARTGAQRFELEKEQFKKQSPQGQFDMIKDMVGDMTPAEEKSIKMKLVGLGKGDDTDAKLAEEVTKKWAENNPGVTPEQVASFNGKLKAGFVTFKQNQQVESVVSGELNAAKGTESYGEKYQQAVQLGLSPDRLKTLGFTPPPKANSAKQAASLGTTTKSAQSAPPDRLTELNQVLDEQTREIDAGKRQQYDPQLMSEIEALKAEQTSKRAEQKSIASKAFVDSERERALRQSRQFQQK